MKIFTLFLLFFFLVTSATQAQVSGNAVHGNSNNNRNYSQSHAIYEQVIAQGDTALLVQVAVLLNEKATNYVVWFGISQEGKTVGEATTLLNKRIESFIATIGKLGINQQDFYVDLITQNRIYNYELQSNNMVAIEKLAGFEVKKNIGIQITQKEMIDKLTLVASEFGIFDLIKVDYLRTDLDDIRQKLFAEATKIIHRKKDQYLDLTKIDLLPQSRLIYEATDVRQPVDSYKSYTAYEAATINEDYYDSYNNRLKKIQARKMTTYYFDTNSYSLFDKVINPIVIEPVIQYSLQLRVRFFIKK